MISRIPVLPGFFSYAKNPLLLVAYFVLLWLELGVYYVGMRFVLTLLKSGILSGIKRGMESDLTTGRHLLTCVLGFRM